MMTSVFDYDESKRRIKLIELRDFLKEILPEDIYKAWSKDLDPVKIIALIEAARLRKISKTFSELSDELKSSKARSYKGILKTMNLDVLYNSLWVIDEEFKMIYSELNKIIPVKELVKKYELDKPILE